MKKEEKLKSKMEKWFIDNILVNIEEKPDSKYPDKIYYVDKNTGYEYMFKDDPKTKALWIDDRLWGFFVSNYSGYHSKVQDLIKHIIIKHMNLLDIMPVMTQSLNMFKL